MTGTLRVGIDIGGTFTDIIVANRNGETIVKKVSSSVDDYAQALVEGLSQVLADAGLEVSQITEFLHGTTIASNTILEMKGARIGLIATRGFRDILEIRNLRMPRLYDLSWEKPAPLVERYLRLTLDERISATGAVQVPLDRKAVEQVVRRLLKERVEGIAVCLLNAHCNPAHEHVVSEVISELAPKLPQSISSSVLPQIREYERTSTTVVNAYLMPLVREYLRTLEHSLGRRGVKAPVLIMQSNGALTPLDDACERPVNIVESGPAAGVVAALKRAVESGHDNVISFDMGGTTAKASLIEGGQLLHSQSYSVGGGIMVSSRLLTGGGYLLGVPAIDIAEVGAGGGSIVWTDAGGSIRVGPESAGAFPGPLCYDRGGERPTVTDANVILGYLNPDFLVDGELQLNTERARAWFDRLVAGPLGLDLPTAAFAARQVAISSMIRAISAVSTERGRDPRQFTLLAFGGNGALFAAGMARELGMRRILIPPAAGVFSAYGLLCADVGHYHARTVNTLVPETCGVQLRERWQELEDEARAQLVNEGYGASTIQISRFANLRYKGQAYEIGIPIDDTLFAGLPESLTDAFGEEHERTYGHRAGAGEPVQIVNIQVLGRNMREDGGGRFSINPRRKPRPTSGSPSMRSVFFGPDHGWRDTAILRREDLAVTRPGPCIIEEYDTTCLVPPNASAVLDDSGNVMIELA
ncbi:MAG: hydantoinase/oxoprolinase family protein [Parvibaculaceae bacterium]